MNSGFSTTRWTQVLEARADSDEGRAALAELCEAYYKPVFGFVRGSVRDEEKARDLTQEFFARLLERHSIGNADPARGRFRSYLLGAAKNFLRDVHDRESASKRSPAGGMVPIHNDTQATNVGFDVADSKAANPEVEFDRKWAMTLLARALDALEKEHAAEGKAEEFVVLKPWLTGDMASPQSAAAEALGMSEAAVKVAIHRLRRSFRDKVKAEIASTLPRPDAALVADEMSYLVWVLQQPSRSGSVAG